MYPPCNLNKTADIQPDSAWTRVLGLNLVRPFTLTQKLLPLLLKSPSPRIIHIGSISGIGVPGLETYAYSASKAGLHHLSQVLAVKLGQRGVRVNTIACGPFESKMMAETLKNVLPKNIQDPLNSERFWFWTVLMVVWGDD